VLRGECTPEGTGRTGQENLDRGKRVREIGGKEGFRVYKDKQVHERPVEGGGRGTKGGNRETGFLQSQGERGNSSPKEEDNKRGRAQEGEER